MNCKDCEVKCIIPMIEPLPLFDPCKACPCDECEEKGCKKYYDTDNINHAKIKLNIAYGNRGGYNSNRIDKDKLKAELFKLEVIKLMLQYGVSISHEDTHGAFKIIDYNQDYVKWFNDAEYEKK